MQKNVGNIDRYARIIIGLMAIGAGIVFKSWWGAFGVVPLVTAFVRWCPAYALFKFSTCKLFSQRDTCRPSSMGSQSAS